MLRKVDNESMLYALKRMVSNPDRCKWVSDDPIYIKYHDEEWGLPIREDRKLFEYLVLESCQSGLSWLTVLKKREGYKELYDGFDPEIVAEYDDKKKKLLLGDQRIIRNKMKIESSIINASAFLEVQKEYGSFNNYIWDYVNHKSIINCYKNHGDIPAETAISTEISKDLKKRGFKGVGSKVMYGFMQAVGMVNDHSVDCFRYKQLL